MSQEGTGTVREASAGRAATYGGRTLRLVLACTGWLAGLTPLPAQAEVSSSSAAKEYEVKAAFVFNFLKFIDWPAGGAEGKFVVAVVGSDEALQACKMMDGKTVQDKTVAVKAINAADVEKAAGEMHVLYLAGGADAGKLAPALQKKPILTIGEANGFIDNGGMINFVVKDQKVRFEINLQAAEGSGLKIKAQLLKLADRVIQKK